MKKEQKQGLSGQPEHIKKTEQYKNWTNDLKDIKKQIIDEEQNIT